MVIQGLQHIEQADTFLPTMYDLPSEDPKESGVPDLFHMWQSDLLSKTFYPPDYKPDQMMLAADLNLYYDLNQPLWHKRPDWFAVLGVPRLYDEWDIRLSYVAWQEKVIPSIVVELLSHGTEKEDLGQTCRKIDEPPTKWEVYEQILGIPWYAVFSRYTDKFRIFQLAELSNGRRQYCEIALSGQKMWLHDLKIGLGLWYGHYQEIERYWLRWYDKDGNWIPTPEEQVEHEKQRVLYAEEQVEHEKRRALYAEELAAKFAAKLKALGVSADDV